MSHDTLKTCLLTASLPWLLGGTAFANDWPQWRGPARDGHVADFDAPDQWPETLTKQWSVTVGDGVATPALVGDRLYVFSLQDGREILRCLDAATGDAIWTDEYEAEGADGPARSFTGPRSSPAVGEGRVVTVGVRGTVSCVDAATGAVVWRKDDFNAWPRFFTSSSPIIADGTCIVLLGGDSDGAIVAYDLATGEPAWTWAGDGAAYGSPIPATLDGRRIILCETAHKLVALDASTGVLCWEMPSEVRGRGYNTITPIVDGDTVIISGAGRGTRAIGLRAQDDAIAGDEAWVNDELSIQFNSPIKKGDGVYGVSNANILFCIDARSGATAWTTPVTGEQAEEQGQGQEQGEGGGRRRRGGGGGGYGSIIDAGPVLMTLTPRAELIVFRPDLESFAEIRRYKVASSETYAYPVLSGRRLFVKDKDSITLWTID